MTYVTSLSQIFSANDLQSLIILDVTVPAAFVTTSVNLNWFLLHAKHQ
jgi:hypothetical protein